MLIGEGSTLAMRVIRSRSISGELNRIDIIIAIINVIKVSQLINSTSLFPIS